MSSLISRVYEDEDRKRQVEDHHPAHSRPSLPSRDREQGQDDWMLHVSERGYRYGNHEDSDADRMHPSLPPRGTEHDPRNRQVEYRRLGQTRPPHHSRNSNQNQGNMGVNDEGYPDAHSSKEGLNRSHLSKDVKQGQGIETKQGSKYVGPREWYLDYYDDADRVMESVVAGDIIMPQQSQGTATAVASSGLRPGAYAMGASRMQFRQDDTGTLESTLGPDQVIPQDLLPIAAEVDGNHDVDLSSQIRRVLEESAVPASSVTAVDGKEEFSSLGSTRQSRRWRRLIIIMMFLLLLAVLAVVAIVVVLFTKDPPPTTTITVVIQLDERPEETGWQLHRGRDKLLDYPAGTYAGETRGLVVARTEVTPGEEHLFTIFDSGGNGIEDGYYEIYDGPDILDPNTRLVQASGDFGEEEKHEFTPVGETASAVDTSCIPIDCETSSWESWSPCSETCNGIRSRSRDVVTNPACNGDPCPHLYEEETCNVNCCIDCEVSEWSPWSPCSEECDGGTRTRSRTVVLSNNNCGTPCPSLEETLACNTQPCQTTTAAPDACFYECCEDTDCDTKFCSDDENCYFRKCANCLSDDDCSTDEVCDCDIGECKPACLDSNCPGDEVCDELGDCFCPDQYECCDDSDCFDNKTCSNNESCMYGKCVYCDSNGNCPGECDCNTGECMPVVPVCQNVECPGATVCDESGDCICPPQCECCDDSPCPEGTFCSNNPDCAYCECVHCDTDDDCADVCDCSTGECKDEPCNDNDCPGDEVCDASGNCYCPYECCNNTYCSGDTFCSDNPDCLYGECVNCDTDDDCAQDCDCNTGECKDEPCNDNDCPGDEVCDSSGNCYCPYECCDNSYCSDGKFCSDNPDCLYGECVNCDTDDDCAGHCDCSIGECKDEPCNDSDCPGDEICDSSGECYCPFECCGSDTPCSGTDTCVNNECIPVCETYDCCDDDDCLSGFVCQGPGDCVEEEPECRDGDCPGDEVCDSSGNCYCPYECCDDSYCSGNEECSSDHECVECVSDSACSGSDICEDNVCIPGCDNSDCPGDEVCDDSGNCYCPFECCGSDTPCSGTDTCVDNECIPVCETYDCCDDDDCPSGFVCQGPGDCVEEEDPPA